MNSRLLIIRSPGRHGRALAANFELQRLRCLKVDGWELRRLAGPMVSELISDQCARASRQIVLELLAEVPIAASLGGIRPIPAQVDRPRRRHSRGGHDGAQCDTVKDGPVVGLRDPRPDGPHDLGGFRGHSTALAHRDMGPSGCDGAMSNRDAAVAINSIAQHARPIGIGQSEFFRTQLSAASKRVKITLPSIFES